MIEKNWQELKKPENKTVKSDDDYPNKATIIVEPFERGFGVTVGNALRRVLLSSLQVLRLHLFKFKVSCTNSRQFLVFVKMLQIWC